MNIYGIGTDLVDIPRFEQKLEKKSFVELVFTPDEIKYCQSRKYGSESFAARFAAKEAYMKALGTGWSQHADFKEIEICRNEEQPPSLLLHGETRAHFEKLNLKEIFVTLSHTDKNAMAFIIITK